LQAIAAVNFQCEEQTNRDSRDWIDPTQVIVDPEAAGDGMDASHRLETFSPRRSACHG